VPGPGLTIVSSANTIQSNFIGTDATGREAVPNAQGLAIGSSAQNNLIGAELSGQRNIIGGNSEWASDLGEQNVIRGNLIGTIPEVEFGPNGAANGVGIMLLGGAAGNVIGGNADGTRANSIRGNEGAGVALSAGGIAGVGATGSGYTIRFNSIDGNGGLGIDLGSNGITPNARGVRSRRCHRMRTPGRTTFRTPRRSPARRSSSKAA
jgi:hypothetical protein